ncbi:MAG: preprotein translocase subunit SecA [Candidatus Omnitrophica bacterium]|nr:preprotein translocase subunit SecA [Candidatus Omnitrophota bacterium]
MERFEHVLNEAKKQRSGFLSKVFGSKSERDIKKMLPLLAAVCDREPAARELPDDRLAARTAEFRERLAQGASLEDILPDAFAVVREAARRRLNMRHFDVQILGGVALYRGAIAEMVTGEGKTLVATLALYLTALEGKGAHLVTVNDYLARRDRAWMGPVYESLGLTVGAIQHESRKEERQAAYNSDITYGTNNEFGFDYLRDNMVLRKEDRVQRELHYAIVDEVDSILVDEARTPLIISGPAEESTSLYYQVDKIVPRLEKNKDFADEEKTKSVYLTEDGIRRVEKLLGIDNLYDQNHIKMVHHIQQALQAHIHYRRDKEYLVKDNKVVIVDEFTGRMMEGRRFSDGLHQALEAKEGVKIEAENQTLATITFQNYFKAYKRLAGMTGTAITEDVEFKNIYNLDVVTIPPNRPLIRLNNPDAIYKTSREKFEAVANDIEALYRKGQPVLAGTVSIEKSELLSRILTRRNIPHQVLNAKHHEKEASIVSEAGRKFKVTIATNMAGRGTDIVLGGSRAEGEPWTEEHQRLAALVIEEYPTVDPEQLKGKTIEALEVIRAGGLHIVGTERHEARRIDNQLRGRSGRQGDPGSSHFYLSLEDELMRLFGSERLLGIMSALPEGELISHPLITRLIENAQRRVEGQNFEVRKQLLDFDNVMNEQRQVTYQMRNQVLEGQDLSGHFQDLILEELLAGLDRYFPTAARPEGWDKTEFNRWFEATFRFPPVEPTDLELTARREALAEQLADAAWRFYLTKRSAVPAEYADQVERYFFLFVVDGCWKSHLYDMDHLREGISLRAYGHQDPLVAYKSEGFARFAQMQEEMRRQLITRLFSVEVSAPETGPRPVTPQAVLTPSSFQHGEFSAFAPQGELRRTQSAFGQPRRPDSGPTTASLPPQRNQASAAPAEPIHVGPRVGRNDPCPCGSGKKYKRCCGSKAN